MTVHVGGFFSQEEAGITAPLKKCGTLYFVHEGLDHASHIDLFVAKEYTGVITEYACLVSIF
jgi:8-oxo-dGTP diphosphatase / 2-hydroxy-dATP diphosphatase